MRQQTELSLHACLEVSKISVTLKPSWYCCLDGDGSIINKNKASPNLKNSKTNSINKDINALVTVNCVPPKKR